MTRPVQGGAALPVAIVGTENSDGSVSSITSTGGIPVSELEFSPVGSHASGTTISSALPLVNPPGATKLLIQALSQNIRYTLDGSNPTASRGFQLKAGDPPVIIPISASTKVIVIEETATASLQAQYGS
jgi:hypothetical protein